MVFNTFHNGRLQNWEHSGDLDLAYGAARAHNRAMVEFCAVDPRPLPTGYVPLADFGRAAAMAEESIAMGAAALLVASGVRPGIRPATSLSIRSGPGPRRPGYPSSSMSGGTGELVDPHYFDNGRPLPPDFHGGDENFRSVDYMAIPGPPAQTLATMISTGCSNASPGSASG